MTGHSKDPAVTVVVVARNEEAKIADCLGSLGVQDYPDFSVILVDDGSTDATVAKARATLPDLKVISSPTRSISRNRDIGWQAARSEYVAFLDADCIAPRDWLSRLMHAALATGAAAVGGGNRPPSGESAHYDALGLMLATFLGSRGSVQGQVPTRGRFVDHLPGLNVMYRTDALQLVGGYDPRFARMGEDEDLSHRLTDLGLKLYATPDATVIHRQRADLASWARNMRGYGRGRTWLVHRHPKAASPLLLLPPLTIPGLPLYLPLIAFYAAWIALRAGRPLLWARLVLLFAATHLAYGFGQIEGLLRKGDGEIVRGGRSRIAMLALKNAGNKGDEAISTCVSGRLVEAIGECDARLDLYLGAIGPSGFDVRPVPRHAHARELLIADMLAPQQSSRAVGQSAFLALPRLVVVLVRFRAIVIAGGQWLHDLSMAKHIAVCAILAFARAFGTATGVYCIGAGPLRRGISRALLRLAFSRDSLIVTRDEASTQLLRSCGYSQAFTASDPAIELAGRRTALGEGKILISPCAWSSFENIYALDSTEIDASVGNWRRLIATLQNRGERIAILPTMNPEDDAFARRIAAPFDGIEIVDTDVLLPGEVQGCIVGAKALISMRLHPIIFASNTGTPFVALNYAGKVRAYCEQAGQIDSLVEMADGDWAVEALDVLDRSARPPSTGAARERQQALLDEAYRQFLGWLRIGFRPARQTIQQAA
ncbi:MAG: glycosyltransferase [Novosphingobium sp.]|nr:glycosyltransferase [Novosphingobium sp.]MCP5403110.1 glycosyltransferase [Novosphingobium sp.]